MATRLRRDSMRLCGSILLCLGVLFAGAAGAREGEPDREQEKEGQAVVQVLLGEVMADVEPLHRKALERELHTHFYMDLRRLAALAQENRMEAAEWLEGLVHQAAEMLEAKEERPDMYDRMAQMRRATNTAAELAEKVRTAPDEQREKLRETLRETLAGYFDLKQEAIGQQIRAMENELAHMKRIYEKRSQQRDRMIEQRLHQLVEQDDELEW